MANTFTEQAAGKEELDIKGKTEEERWIQPVLVNPELFNPRVVEWRRVKALASRAVVRSIAVVVKVLV